MIQPWIRDSPRRGTRRASGPARACGGGGGGGAESRPLQDSVWTLHSSRQGMGSTVVFMSLVIFMGTRLRNGMLKGPDKITDLTLLAVRRNRIGGVRLRVSSKDMKFPGTSQLVDSQELVVVGSQGRILDALGIRMSELPWDKH